MILWVFGIMIIAFFLLKGMFYSSNKAISFPHVKSVTLNDGILSIQSDYCIKNSSGAIGRNSVNADIAISTIERIKASDILGDHCFPITRIVVDGEDLRGISLLDKRMKIEYVEAIGDLVVENQSIFKANCLEITLKKGE